MLRYILWRIAVMMPTLLIISALVFTIIELPPGDYFESYIAELQGRRRRRRPGADRGPAPGIRLRPAAGAALFPLGRRHAPRRLRLFLRVPAAGQRRGRRPAVADHAGLLRHHHLHLADRLSDRHLFGDPPVQLGRLRADLPRPARHRHPEFHAGADPDVFRQYLVRHLDRPSDGCRILQRSR